MTISTFGASASNYDSVIFDGGRKKKREKENLKELSNQDALFSQHKYLLITQKTVTSKFLFFLVTVSLTQ